LLVTLDERIETLAAPAFRAFLATDRAVREAVRAGPAAAAGRARSAAMLTARQASAEMHRLADAADADRPSWLPDDVRGPAPVRSWVQARYCRSLRGGPCLDLDLLDDVENAFKHVKLRPSRVPRRVVSDRAVLSSETGYGGGGYGEGVFGGAEQMIVTTLDGSKRALSAILQNNLDAWRLAMGLILPPMEQ
jgi:hypothetical protein